MNQSFYTFHESSSQILKQTYHTILHSLGAKNFGYLRVYKQNARYIYLTNNSNIARSYLGSVDQSNIFFKECLDKQCFANKEYYYVLWPDTAQNLSMDIYLKNKYWNGLSIISQNQDFIEVWWVAASLQDERMKSLYYKQSFRKEFLILVDYFNKIMSSMVKIPSQQDLACYYKGFNFSLPNEEIEAETQKDYERKNLLLKTLYPKGISVKSNAGLIKLTYKEIRLLELLALGNQTKQIAVKLGNQTKTIENQKAHIKLKTGYNLNSDLVKLYNDQIKFLVE